MTDSKGIDRVASGIAGLDVILQGGFTKGGIHIVQGAPGAGKTTLANQLCFNHANHGGRALYVTLLSETHSRMLLHLGTMQFLRSIAVDGTDLLCQRPGHAAGRRSFGFGDFAAAGNRPAQSRCAGAGWLGRGRRPGHIG